MEIVIKGGVSSFIFQCLAILMIICEGICVNLLQSGL